MNTNIKPDAASASSTHNNLCFDIDPAVAMLNVFADDERSYHLPYAQFLYAELTPNPALEHKPDAPPEKMLIRFAKAEVVILGNGFKALERALQKYELKFVKSADRRYAATLKTHIAAISVSLIRNKEANHI
jgi:hypothetical protein